MMKDKVSAIKNLYQEHSEQMLLLALMLTCDPKKSRKIVDDIFIELWEWDDFNIDEQNLFLKVREACQQ